MLRAGALIYTVFISFLITIICGLLISFSLIYNKNFITEFKRGELLNNVYSGINVALFTPNLIDFDQELVVDLYNDAINIVELEKKRWGGYEIIKARSSWSNFNEYKIALVGIDWRSEENVALYLTDKNDFLYVSGNTFLRGDCFVPGAQVKTTRIEGRGFLGKQPVKGEVYKSLIDLPLINQGFIDINSKYLSNGYLIGDSSYNYNSFNSQSEIIYNSFLNKTLVLYSEDNILIKNKRINGNVIIKSETLVEISSDCDIDNILIYAPEVIIRDGFEGAVQVFAKTKIRIEENCKLKYPSFICTINDKSEIIVSEGCEIDGGVFLFLTNKENVKQSGIEIKKNATVYGQVYSNGYIQHKGILYGTMYCENFMLKTKSSLYENHLLDAIIDLSKLSENFVGNVLLYESTNRKIIDWLN
jgi:hypothetical protein